MTSALHPSRPSPRARFVVLATVLIGWLVGMAEPAAAAEPVARDLRFDAAGFTAFGAAKGDRLGLSLTMGDLNGDRIDDIAAGAPLAEKPGDTLFNRGALHVYFGKAGLAGVRDAAQEPPDLVIYGENGGEKDNNKSDVLGKGVAIGDVNGDGKNDLVVSALRADVGTEKRDRLVGKVYVFFQPQDGVWPSVIDLSSPNPAKPPDVTIIGDQPSGDFGIHLAVTDFDGDGNGDVVIGAAATLRTHPDNRGQVWVVYGGPGLPSTIDLRNPPPPEVRTLNVIGEEEKDKLGHAVSVGDLNDDGAPDIAAGAPRGGGECNTIAGGGGKTFVIYGTKPPATARTGTIELSSGTPPQEVSKIHSAEPEDQMGRRIHVGDVSGDSQADLIMGARCSDGPQQSRPDAGTAHVLFGPISPGTTRNVTTSPVNLRVYGGKPGDLLSTGTGSGDLTGDAKGDLVLGADGDPGPAGRTGAGSAFVFFGGIPAGVWDLAMKVADVAIHAPDANDRLGRFIATGDVNGDGRADLGVTAYFANGFNNATGNETGEVHVLTALGGDPAPPPPPPPPPTGTHTLTVEKDGNGLVRSKPGGIDCGSDCEEPYTEGTEVKLVAKADDGHSFLGWGGDCSGQGGTRCILTMDADKAVVATFSGGGEPPPPPSDTFTLEVKKDGTGSGVVRSKPDGIVCGQTCEATFASGTEVQLTARADDGSSFGGWSGDCAGGGIRCTLVMDGDKTVTATFTSP